MTSPLITAQFHEHYDASRVARGQFVNRQDYAFAYRFENFFHPYVAEMKEQLNLKSLAGLGDPKFLQQLKDNFFDSYYTRSTDKLVRVETSPKEVDLNRHGPYANYNWELLFHAHMFIAGQFTKNNRFAECQRWFHTFLFDPTSRDTSLPVPQRYWKFLAFRSEGKTKSIDEQLAILSKPASECTKAELDLKGDLLAGYSAIQRDPFQPDKVARSRPFAYQYWVVMKYLDNLITWGDSLFLQDTQESITEATQLYVLAANLLGHRPQRIPPAGPVAPKTYAALRANGGFDALGNRLVALEGKFPLNLGVPQVVGVDPDAGTPLFGIARALYFCIPRNEKLLSYWDTVADRLFKIRHCMNIQGLVRQLPLFDPPLDPGMLVKAAAAGIDISSIVSGLNQPVSPVRAQLLLQKAVELCSEVRALGAALLAAIEKGEAEQLAVLRQTHEIEIQKRLREVRFLQKASAQEVVKSLLVGRKAPLERLRYYKRLLGLGPDPNAPDDLAVDFDKLSIFDQDNFATAYNALLAQYDQVAGTETFPPLDPSTEGRARLHLTKPEDEEFEHLKRARDSGLLASTFNTIAAGLVMLPEDTKVNLHFWGMGGTVTIPVGKALVSASKIPGDIAGIVAGWEREQASLAVKSAAYDRRADEWRLQHNLATHELRQIGRQILTSIIAEQVAHHEYEVVDKQLTNATAVNTFLATKYSNETLYVWMQGEISRLYYEYYRFAFDLARKAERAMKRELMRPELDAQDFLKFNYWDGGRKGLLSGEALYLDVKRMELAYHENNKREYELTRHVSLRQLDPVALLELRSGGECQLTIPEWVFDLDTPGHYMRRIKTVALTIPCVTGPYTSIACTLTLMKSSLRTSPSLDDGYKRRGSEDGRFVDYFSATQSIVTSSGQSDSGLFETNLRDERFLPFEGAGAESTWKLELPKEYRKFDYSTITDVIVHIRYTAREGGSLFREKVVAALKDSVGVESAGLWLLLSLRAEFPSEWEKFVKAGGDFTAKIRRDHFPYFTERKRVVIERTELFRVASPNLHPLHRVAGDAARWNAQSDELAETKAFVFTESVLQVDQVLTGVREADVFLIVRYALV